MFFLIVSHKGLNKDTEVTLKGVDNIVPLRLDDQYCIFSHKTRIKNLKNVFEKCGRGLPANILEVGGRGLASRKHAVCRAESASPDIDWCKAQANTGQTDPHQQPVYYSQAFCTLRFASDLFQRWASNQVRQVAQLASLV